MRSVETQPVENADALARLNVVDDHAVSYLGYIQHFIAPFVTMVLFPLPAIWSDCGNGAIRYYISIILQMKKLGKWQGEIAVGR
jgi:hypothetical protein